MLIGNGGGEMSNGGTIACAECSVQVHDEDEARALHIYEQHLQKQLFTCFCCDYSSTHDELNVEEHIADQHSPLTKKEIVSNVHLYSDEIREWSSRCWPDSFDTDVDADEAHADQNDDENDDVTEVGLLFLFVQLGMSIR